MKQTMKTKKTTKLAALSAAALTLAIGAAAARADEPAAAGSVRPLAELARSGGLAGLPAMGVRVLSDGRVQAFAGRAMPVEVARLSPAKTSQLARMIGEIPAQDLVDAQAGEPFCMDGPVTEARGYRAGAGDAVELHRSAGCHEFEHPDSRARVVTDVLTGLDALQQLN